MFNDIKQKSDIPNARRLSRDKQAGAATLLFATAVLAINTMMVIFAANQGSIQDKSVANQTRVYQAKTAANAGMEYGIVYLQQNGSTILANPVGGFIQPYTDSNVTNVSLPNNTQFTVTYSNPIANNYDLILVTSTGISDDGTSTRVVSQLIHGSGGGLGTAVDVPLIAKGEADYGGNGRVINTFTDQTIRTGGTIDLQGNAKTEISSGVSSTSSVDGPDITENDANLSSLSNDQFFTEIFGSTPNTVESGADLTYSNSGTTSYNGLDGVTGSTIWINQTSGKAKLTSNTTIGSPDNPVVLIIDGEAQFTGNTLIYGYVFILGNDGLDMAGNAQIIGGVSTSSDIKARGNAKIVYNPTVLSNLNFNSGTTTYARVPGSWRDF